MFRFRRSHGIFLATLLVAACSLALSCPKQSPVQGLAQGFGGVSGQTPILQKTAKADDSVKNFTVRLEGLRDSDVVTIRPGTRPEASAGGWDKVMFRQNWGFIAMVRPGAAPDESSLVVTSSTVSFKRSPAIGDVAFLDVTVSRGVLLRVIVDGKTVSSASLTNSRSFSGGSWSEGADSINDTARKAFMAAMAFPGGRLIDSPLPQPTCW